MAQTQLPGLASLALEMQRRARLLSVSPLRPQQSELAATHDPTSQEADRLELSLLRYQDAALGYHAEHCACSARR